ncbi:uncharacterized protein LOC143896747 [Temnothorax americanus]|uniref:uncharacterized protein LOC143896747 n=1 Tax=Temnothorax americanus TaxID=1964332 RepID=UPI004068F71F
MPGCAAPNCYNSSEKKFKMCTFPLKDPKRCAVWISTTVLPQITIQNETKTPDKELFIFEQNVTENNEIDINDISSEEIVSEDEKMFVMQQNELINNESFKTSGKGSTKNEEISKCNKEAFLRYDQIKLLCGYYKKVPVWCNETLQKAYRYKFAYGSSGYEEIARDLPLPSLQTLRRRLQRLQFDSGILNEVFDFLAIKVSQFQSGLDKFCGIILDEMKITPGHTFDHD